MHDGDESDETEIKAESDDDATAFRRFAPSAPPRSAKGNHRLFRTGDALQWDARTSSPAMLELVRQREQVFSIMRQAFPEVERLEESEEAWAAALKATGVKGATKDNLQYAFNAWLRFCDAAAVPPFPMSWQLVALCTFARSSADPQSAWSTFVGTLERYKGWTDDIWDGHRVVRALDAVADGEAALREFVGQATASRALGPDVHKDNIPSGSSRRRSAPGPSSKRACPPSSREGQPQRAAPSLDLSCPDLPLANERFDTLDQVMFAVVRAVFFVYGSTCRIVNSSSNESHILCARAGSSSDDTACPFRLEVVRDTTTCCWMVDSARSFTSHNHKCDPRFLADPTWRPVLADDLARAAVGLGPVPSSLERPNVAGAAPVPIKKAKHVPTHEPTLSSSCSSSPVAVKPRLVDRLDPRPAFHRPLRHDGIDAAVPPQPPFYSYLVSYLEELDELGRLNVLAPHLLANGVDSITKVLALVDDPPKVRDLMAHILRQAPGGELNDPVLEFVRLAGG
ncbi:hypothetical protein JCM8208_007212 [Rhodotorula glutinis]